MSGSNGTLASAYQSTDNGTVENYDWVVLVDAVICGLTIGGAGIILGSMLLRELQGKAATVRTRLVQGLVASDFMLGMIALIPSARYLQGHPTHAGTHYCDGFGVLLTAIIWSEHLWTFSLALATYLILLYPLAPSTRLLEKRWPYIWLLIWVFSFAIAILGYKLYGYFPTGGFCYYGKNAGLYAELMQFIPRALVFLAVSFFYARLYVFLRRPDKIRSSFSPCPKHGYTSSEQDQVVMSGRRGSGDRTKQKLREQLSRFSFGHGDTKGSSGQAQDGKTVNPQSRDAGEDDAAVALSGRRDRKRTNTSDSLRNGLDTRPPWEKLELPMYQSQPQPARNPLNDFVFSWDDWKGSRPVSPTVSASQTPLQVVVHGPHARGGSVSESEISSIPSSAYMEVRVESRRPSAIASAQVPSPVLENDEWQKQLREDGPSPLTSPRGTTQARFFDDYSMSPGQRRGSGKSDLLARDFAIEEGSIRYVLAHGGQSAASSDVSSAQPQSDVTQATSAYASDVQAADRKSSVAFVDPEKPTETVVHDSKAAGPDDIVAADDNVDMDFSSALRELGGMADEPGRQSRSNSEKVELVPESTASYLNRKTSLLMLYFPLAYCALFSVSIIRLIYDFASPNTPVALKAISRWFIFAQGLVDAIIYGVIEWRTKRVVRKKLRKGALSSDRGGSTGSHNSMQSLDEQDGTSPAGSQVMSQIRSSLRASKDKITLRGRSFGTTGSMDKSFHGQ